VSWTDIPGYSGFEWLYAEFAATAPKNAIAVEVGVALGHSVAYLARLLIDAGRTDVQVWAVDPWAGVARNGEQQEALGTAPRGDFRLFLDQMIAHAPEELEFIRIVRAPSEVAAEMFFSLFPTLVLIDAAHDYDSVALDISVWSRCVRSGGILAGDDHEPNYPGVERACREAFGTDYKVAGSTWHRRM